ncbi:hypothetical protein EB796_003019 [Bugula neritina]|uniref:Uncharacterized protein n=1 Tax=Bugula neritina TaxID=10212 RepID=A0A7J7KJ03_BUGNE|nr:hypothetical protein EB796_003019 [Bugula neritina]
MSSAAIRSSVRPKSSKQPWGTILKPSFGLGYQKMTKYEVDQSVSRLHVNKKYREREYHRHEGRPLSSTQINDMVGRLMQNSLEKTPDTNRTQQNSIYREMGPVNSYAWKGYN